MKTQLMCHLLQEVFPKPLSSPHPLNFPSAPTVAPVCSSILWLPVIYYNYLFLCSEFPLDFEHLEGGDVSSLHPQGLAKCLVEYQVLNVYLWTELMKAI